MRMVVAIAALALVAGCSESVDGQAKESGSVSSAPAASSGAVSTPGSPTTTAVPTTPPAAAAPIAAVIAWVRAGTEADPAGFRTATRDGESTDLGEGVAFVAPSGKTQCRTDATMTSGALACLVELADPPAQPAEVYGHWVDNWVDFDGAVLQVGSVHADPGPFTAGKGPELPYGSTLRFGDYQCRSDPAGLFCVNYARQSAVGMSDAGVVPFGCLQEVQPPADIGVKFECG
jgi:hypothetical protein